MKRKFLIFSILTSVYTMALTTNGYIEGKINGNIKFEKGSKLSHKLENSGVSGEISFNKRVTLGANILAKQKEPRLEASNVYLKYTNDNITGKITVNPKKDNGNVELDGELKKGIFKFTTNTVIPFKATKDNVLSTSTVTLGNDKVNASLGFKHSYGDETLKYVETKLEAKNDNLIGKAQFRYQFNGTSKIKNLLTEEDDSIELNKNSYAHSYEVEAKKSYFTIGAFAQHIHYTEVSLDKITPYDMMDVYETKEERKEKLRAKETAEAALKAVENHKEQYLKYKEAVDKAIKGVGEYFKEEVNNLKPDYDSLKNNKNAKKYEDAYNRKAEIDEKISELEFKQIDFESLEGKKGINEEVRLKRLKEIYDLIDENKGKSKKVNEELDDIVKVLTSDESKKVSDYLKAKKELEKYEKNNNGFTRGHVGKYKFDDKGNRTTGANGKTIGELETKLKDNEYYQKKEVLDSAIKELSYDKKEYDLISASKSSVDLVNFGVKLGFKYEDIKNLTLTLDGVFGGTYHSEFVSLKKFPSYTTSYIKLHAGAKYEYKGISPEINITTKFVNLVPELVLAPKLSVERDIVEHIKTKGFIEAPIKFGGKEFKYIDTSIKGGISLRYSW
ncbi:hypothetical protein [uncultured Sneathia sp.]|uniref:hypothetical protein n=1 Tax=uncultured Sneathia sp. TaxID=278067 RepID=UPI0025961A8E|nr:hypothetical protein [uncultured Sneathia sp.]